MDMIENRTFGEIKIRLRVYKPAWRRSYQWICQCNCPTEKVKRPRAVLPKEDQPFAWLRNKLNIGLAYKGF